MECLNMMLTAMPTLQRAVIGVVGGACCAVPWRMPHEPVVVGCALMDWKPIASAGATKSTSAAAALAATNHNTTSISIICHHVG
jgi:hypothetical protein